MKLRGIYLKQQMCLISIIASGFITFILAGSYGDRVINSYTPNQIAGASTMLLVTSTADYGPGSLRRALLEAQAGDTITFADTLAGQIITPFSPLIVTQDGVTLNGLSTPKGKPKITLDGSLASHEIGTPMLYIYASDFTMTRLRFVGNKYNIINVEAGEQLWDPQPPLEVRNIRIEDCIFDNTGVEQAKYGGAIWIRTEPELIATNATISNIKVARNTFSNFRDVGVIFPLVGTNCVIKDIVIEDNVFINTRNPIDVGTGPVMNNRIIGVRILRNLCINAVNPCFISNSGFKNIIQDIVIEANVFIGEYESVNIRGGFTDGGINNTSRNTVVDVQCINNLFKTGRGIHIIGGVGGTGNSVKKVWIINNTIITTPLAGLRIDTNKDGGYGNSVTNVNVLNTIFLGLPGGTPGGDRPEEDIAGEVKPSQVRYSRTSTHGFAGINGNISSDPMFKSIAEGNYRLKTNSPCINAGLNEYSPDRDIVLVPRPQEGEVDMGCYEHVAKGTIFGFVTKAFEGIPLKNVKVKAKRLGTRFTAGDGYFGFADVEDGIWELIVRKKGYKKIEAKVNVSGGGKYKQNFRLEQKK